MDDIFDKKNFKALMNHSDFLSFFLNYGQRQMDQVWCGHKCGMFRCYTDPIPEIFGAKHIETERIHPCAD